MGEMEDRIGSLETAIREAVDASKAKEGKANDALPELAAARTKLAELVADKKTADAKAEIDAAVKEAVKAALLDVRSPSIASQVGNAAIVENAAFRFAQNVHPALKAWLPANYEAGSIANALAGVKSVDGFASAKATLDGLGLGYLPNPEGKATLGTTGAAGGYVLPNNLVATLVKPNTQFALYTQGANPLVTVINGVAVRGIDQPYRTGAPTRMTAQDWGATKDNRDETYGTYTATLGTFAAIYDVGKQYLRFSAGAAETDIIDELTKAAELAENYSVVAGAGTGSATPGINDPTLGVYTALVATNPTYTTAVTASSSTVAGSAATGLMTAFGALATRSRIPSAIVTDAVTYWTLFTQGSDSAGFWMSDFLGAGFAIGADNTIRLRGIPIYFDSNFNTNTSTTKRAIVGDWKALKFYRGMEFRIDTSDIAGERWAKNLVGFRGEMEIGVNANTATAVGAFQLITGLIP